MNRRVRGFACPRSPEFRLTGRATRKPMRGLVVRYRKCPVCGYRTVTQEKPRPPREK